MDLNKLNLEGEKNLKVRPGFKFYPKRLDYYSHKKAMYILVLVFDCSHGSI